MKLFKLISIMFLCDIATTLMLYIIITYYIFSSSVALLLFCVYLNLKNKKSHV